MLLLAKKLFLTVLWWMRPPMITQQYTVLLYKKLLKAIESNINLNAELLSRLIQLIFLHLSFKNSI